MDNSILCKHSYVEMQTGGISCHLDFPCHQAFGPPEIQRWRKEYCRRECKIYYIKRQTDIINDILKGNIPNDACVDMHGENEVINYTNKHVHIARKNRGVYNMNLLLRFVASTDYGAVLLSC